MGRHRRGRRRDPEPQPGTTVPASRVHAAPATVPSRSCPLVSRADTGGPMSRTSEGSPRTATARPCLTRHSSPGHSRRPAPTLARPRLHDVSGKQLTHGCSLWLSVAMKPASPPRSKCRNSWRARKAGKKGPFRGEDSGSQRRREFRIVSTVVPAGRLGRARAHRTAWGTVPGPGRQVWREASWPPVCSSLGSPAPPPGGETGLVPALLTLPRRSCSRPSTCLPCI